MMATRMASLITQNLCRPNRKQEEVDDNRHESTLQILVQCKLAIISVLDHLYPHFRLIRVLKDITPFWDQKYGSVMNANIQFLYIYVLFTILIMFWQH
jgi:hypothetical protein